MPQHDYDIANQAGAAFRADLNAALAAIVGNNSGASAPTTTFAYMYWADTTTGYLKQRNAANTAWVLVEKLDQDMLAAVQAQTFTAFTSAGAAPAFTLTPSPAIAAYAANQRFRVAFNAAGTTGSNTLNISGLGIKNIKQYDSTGAKVAAVVASGQLADVEYDGVDMVILDPLPAASALPLSVPVRQTVLGGPVSTAGLPTFLPATSASLSILSQNISAGAPFVVASANGFGATGAIDRVGQSTANLTWPGLTASQTNYLYVDVAADGTLTPGSTIVAPVYQFGGTPSVINNQATFNISQMQMFVGNGSTAPQIYRVFVGEAVAGVSTITSTVAYAYMGRYDSGFTQNLPASSTLTSKNHNIGTEIKTEAVVECTTADGGYAVGDQIYPMTRPTNEYSRLNLVRTRNTIGISTGATAAFIATNKTTGAVVEPLAQTSWKWKILAERSW